MVNSEFPFQSLSRLICVYPNKSFKRCSLSSFGISVFFEILEKINGSWAKRIWHEEVIADVVNYSVNNKEMLTELLKTNNVIKEMVMEDLFEKAIEHKYWINKIGENTVKEVITYIATEYKSRNKLEEKKFSTIVKENKNNNKINPNYSNSNNNSNNNSNSNNNCSNSN